MKKSTHFTLLELLCVICIILILASLLYPSLVRAQQVAKIAVCASSQKQLHYGFTQFEKNWRRLPPGANLENPERGIPWGFTDDEPVSWDDRIAPYIGRTLTDAEFDANRVDKKGSADTLLRCPSDMDDDPIKLIRTYSVNSYDLWFSQKWYAAGALIPDATTTGVIGFMISRRSGEIQSAGQTFLLTEGFNQKWKYAGCSYYSALSGDSNFAPYKYHNGKRVALYIDGHSQVISNSSLLPGTDSFLQNISIR